MIAGVAPASAQTDPFVPWSWLDVDETQTFAVAAGDVDGDGDLDVVCGNYYGNAELYLNVGTALGSVPLTYSTAQATWDLALGDLDRDGDLDLVCANFNRANTVFMNEGELFAQDPILLLETDATTSVELCDLDGDGFLDIVFGNTAVDGAENVVYYNDQGTFDSTAGVFFDGPRLTTDLVAGDVDGDGDPDVVCATQDDGLTLYGNDGGTLTLRPGWTTDPTRVTVSLALGDIDGDGWLDLACGNADGPNTVFINGGGAYPDGPAWQSADTASTASIALGDADGDGDPDLACANVEQGNVLYRNDGSGLDPQPAWTSDDAWENTSVAWADIDGDGAPDLVFGRDSQPNALFGNTRPALEDTAGWIPDASSSPNTVAVALGDVNGDGYPDIVCGNLGIPGILGQSNQVFAGTAGLPEATPRPFAGASYTKAVALGDLDGDGRMDAVCAHEDQPATVHLGSTDYFTDPADWSSSGAGLSTDVALGDLDRDGRLDVVVAAGDGEPGVVFLNAGGLPAAEASWVFAGGRQTEAVALGDIDADGYLDVVCGNRDQQNNLYLNDGGGGFGEAVWSSDHARNTTDVALGDVDGDGDLDLVCANFSEPHELYLNDDGELAVQPVWTSDTTYATQGIALVDVDRDGDLDLVCANRDASNTLYRNENGIFTAEPVWETVETSDSYDLAAGDLDGDGDADLVCGNSNGRTTLYRGGGHPAWRGDPLDPAGQLVNNPTYLRGVDVIEEDENLYRIAFEAVDLEYDPFLAVIEYQFAGGPFRPAAVSHIGGGQDEPLAASPAGVSHTFDWDVSGLPVDHRSVSLRLRTPSPPHRAGLIRQVPAFGKDLGPVHVYRPQVAVFPAALVYPRMTVGDEEYQPLVLSNGGNQTLSITDIGLPSAELTHDAALPLDVPPAGSRTVSIASRPREETTIVGDLVITSNDTVTGPVHVPLMTDILALELTTQVMIEEGAPAPLGEALSMMVVPGLDVHVERGAIHYRTSGAAEPFAAAELGWQGEILVGSVPGIEVTELDVEFYIEIENNGVFATDPPAAPDSLFTQEVALPDSVQSAPIDASGVGFLLGQPVSLGVTLLQGTVFRSGTLHYRQGGRLQYESVALSPQGGLLLGSVPAEEVTSRGLEYWVEIHTEGRMEPLFDPPAEPSLSPYGIAVTVPDLQEPEEQPAKRYRIISIPLHLREDFAGSLEDMLSSQPEFGSYLNTRWRCFTYVTQEHVYAELDEAGRSELFRPEPGRAYWLICREPSRVTTAPVSGFSVSTDSNFSTVVVPGWNLVGNPFDFAVAWDSLRIDGSLAALSPDRIEPPVAWEEDSYRSDVTVLQPFAGYWFKVLGDQDRILEIPPVESTEEPPVKAAGCAWRVAVHASCSPARDACNAFGRAPNASDEWDARDRSEPPRSPGDVLSLYFPHDDWIRHAGDYSVDIRSAGTGKADGGGTPDAGIWRFDVAKGFAGGDSRDKVELRFEGMESVPAQLQMVLLDLETGAVRDLRLEPTYRFPLRLRSPVTSADRTRFAVLVGDEELVARGRDLLPAEPRRTRLRRPGPNPFNPSTLIRYELDRAGAIQLTIHDLTGARIRTLRNGNEPVGRYEIAWRGCDDHGRGVAAGVYFVRLSTGWGHRQIHKITLVK